MAKRRSEEEQEFQHASHCPGTEPGESRASDLGNEIIGLLPRLRQLGPFGRRRLDGVGKRAPFGKRRLEVAGGERTADARDDGLRIVALGRARRTHGDETARALEQAIDRAGVFGDGRGERDRLHRRLELRAQRGDGRQAFFGLRRRAHRSPSHRRRASSMRQARPHRGGPRPKHRRAHRPRRRERAPRQTQSAGWSGRASSRSPSMRSSFGSLSARAASASSSWRSFAIASSRPLVSTGATPFSAATSFASASRRGPTSAAGVPVLPALSSAARRSSMVFSSAGSAGPPGRAFRKSRRPTLATPRAAP